jgi:hypothetical protein
MCFKGGVLKTKTMKTIIKIFTLLLFTSVLAQTSTESKATTKTDSLVKKKLTGLIMTETDTEKIRQIYNFKKKGTQVAFFIDSIFTTPNTYKYLNLDSKEINTLNVEKKSITIGNELYEAQLYVFTKKPKDYEFLTLYEVKRHFTKSKKNKTIFIIDDELVKDKVETYKLDKNNILSVSLTDTENAESLKEQNVDFDIVEIKTKTPKNILKSKEIILRGNDVSEIK